MRIHRPWAEEDPPESTVNFTAEHKRQRVSHFVQGLHGEQTGDVVLEILMNGKHAGSHTITIRAREEDM